MLQMNTTLTLINQASKKWPFFFLIQKMWSISLKNTYILKFLPWCCSLTSSLVLT